MLIWNVKGSTLKALKTPDLYFKFGEEVPADEVDPGRAERMLKAGWLKEGEVKKEKKAEPLFPPPGAKPEPKAEPKPLEDEPKAGPKPKKKGRR